MKTFSHLLLVAPFILAGCAGYSPLYAPQTKGEAVQIGAVAMAEVEVQPGQRLVAQEVRQRLLQSFPSATGAVAEITITESATTLALRRTATIERVQLTLTATLKVRNEQGEEKLNTSLSSIAAYNIENTPFSTESGKAYARQIAARNLADSIARRLALWARTK
ncbi:MAG: LPS assembly lipoprotein LptE [Pseudomonadota bacterium]|jgi:hypothetical protein